MRPATKRATTKRHLSSDTHTGCFVVAAALRPCWLEASGLLGSERRKCTRARAAAVQLLARVRTTKWATTKRGRPYSPCRGSRDERLCCSSEFCSTELGLKYCENVRDFFVEEAEALGPAVARYFASKLWGGETYFMQIDAHSLFEEGWDSTLIADILNTPSYPRSVLSHYPPDTKVKYQNQAGYRICGAEFAKSAIEHDIIRLGAGVAQDSRIQKEPCPAPFIGAGFFFAHADFLGDIPFDPYVPWVFMGEEILLSLRFWTWGYDIYSPTRNVLSHFYVRRHTPKFWETVNRLFHKGTIHNDITAMIIHRVKSIAGYPESSTDVLMMPSLLAELDLYGDGDVRAMEDYMDIVGLDMVSKRTRSIKWCTKCEKPYVV